MQAADIIAALADPAAKLTVAEVREVKRLAYFRWKAIEKEAVAAIRVDDYVVFERRGSTRVGIVRSICLGVLDVEMEGDLVAVSAALAAPATAEQVSAYKGRVEIAAVRAAIAEYALRRLWRRPGNAA